jgi:hypothetical protein
MQNFNLKKFLVENKLTTNSRMLKEQDEYGEYQEVVYEDDTERVLLVYEPTEDGASYNPETGIEGGDMPWYTVSDAHGEDWEVLNSYFEKPTYGEVSKDVQDYLDSIDKEFDEKGFNTNLFGGIRTKGNLRPDPSVFSANENRK